MHVGDQPVLTGCKECLQENRGRLRSRDRQRAVMASETERFCGILRGYSGKDVRGSELPGRSPRRWAGGFELFLVGHKGPWEQGLFVPSQDFWACGISQQIVFRAVGKVQEELD